MKLINLKSLKLNLLKGFEFVIDCPAQEDVDPLVVNS